LTNDEMPFEYVQDEAIMRCLIIIIILCIVGVFGILASIVLSWFWFF